MKTRSLCVLPLLLLAGCHGGFMGTGLGAGSPLPSGGHTPSVLSIASVGGLFYIAGALLLLFAVGTFVLAKYLWPTLPTTASIRCGVAACACFVMAVIWQTFFWVMAACLLIAFIISIWPYLVSFYNKFVRKPQVNALATAGDTAAALALAKKAEPDDHDKPGVLADIVARVQTATF